MALISATRVTPTATTVTPAAAATSMTIAAADIGAGVFLRVINGAGADITVTIADPGTTQAGNPGTTTAQTVATSAERQFKILPAHVNPATNVATVTLSSATTITYTLIK